MLDKKVQEVLDMLKEHDNIFKEVPTNNGCLHYSCSDCKGTGQKKNGGVCIHMISCLCSNCAPRC